MKKLEFSQEQQKFIAAELQKLVGENLSEGLIEALKAKMIGNDEATPTKGDKKETTGNINLEEIKKNPNIIFSIHGSFPRMGGGSKGKFNYICENGIGDQEIDQFKKYHNQIRYHPRDSQESDAVNDFETIMYRENIPNAIREKHKRIGVETAVPFTYKYIDQKHIKKNVLGIGYIDQKGDTRENYTIFKLIFSPETKHIHENLQKNPEVLIKLFQEKYKEFERSDGNLKLIKGGEIVNVDLIYSSGNTDSRTTKQYINSNGKEGKILISGPHDIVKVHKLSGSI